MPRGAPERAEPSPLASRKAISTQIATRPTRRASDLTLTCGVVVFLVASRLTRCASLACRVTVEFTPGVLGVSKEYREKVDMTTNAQMRICVSANRCEVRVRKSQAHLPRTICLVDHDGQDRPKNKSNSPPYRGRRLGLAPTSVFIRAGRTGEPASCQSRRTMNGACTNANAGGVCVRGFFEGARLFAGKNEESGLCK